ncbi:potassium uptake protein, TrkH family [Pleurocapsa sp. PCC 7327]|uniref:TrkH family potassium uptake protein n=1 Tax=Pleurocapsa sp. PCC 7327 TaxID=118163 RepID=UPI00029FFCEB|nr:TrkH family potassium uptake protein [Pleurocapsa sp. PCC 7327]AFY75617.1 potassium uptake protein, TrkH family [Pleurocapsa sp. PCC 7327]
MTISRTICLGFLAVITVGTLLLIFPFSTSDGSWNNPIVALFTATSAVCVTGLAVVDTGTYFSFWGQLIILLLAQVGGLGYMTITTFLMLLIGRKFDLQQRFAIQESFDRPFILGSQNLIRSIIATTLIFEITGIFLMLYPFSRDYGLEQGLWLSIFHSVSAWNNAGFSLFKDSLIGYRSSPIINLTITGLIIFGGIGYQVIIELYSWLTEKCQRKKARFVFSLNLKVVVSTTIILLGLGTITIFFAELRNDGTFVDLNLQEKLLAAWFQSVTSRTAGFNTLDIGKMTVEGLFITMILMFIGASPSGTGGGIKTTTLRVISSCTRSVLRGDEEVILYQRKVPYPLILKAIAVVFGSVMTIFIATLIISYIENNLNALAILFEVISAFATVGLSMGITASLSPLSQLVIVAVMYIGRVGIIILIAAIIGDPRPSVIQYPEENLLVG